MKNNNTLVIFGAPDHEEALARKIAEASGRMVATATLNGNPVHAGNAYKADDIEKSIYEIRNIKKIILFECGGKKLEDWLSNYFEFNGVPVIKCDHHNPGDPGYDKGPDEFWDGSSIGQLCGILGISTKDAGQMLGINWREIWMTAAADHCPKDAYAGWCPGIGPEEFFEFRLLQNAQFNLGKNVEWEALDEEIFRLRNVIKEAEKKIEIAHKIHTQFDPHLYFGVPIDELPEAAMKVGVSYVTKINEADHAGKPTGRKKIILGGCTSPEDIEKFMAWARTLGNRVGEPYGSPVRGFAGIIITTPHCPTCKGEANNTRYVTHCPACGEEYPEFG